MASIDRTVAAPILDWRITSYNVNTKTIVPPLWRKERLLVSKGDSQPINRTVVKARTWQAAMAVFSQYAPTCEVAIAIDRVW